MTALPIDLADQPTLLPPSAEPTIDGPTSAVLADPDALARGTIVSRYVVLQRIGVGGMGVVYAAYDPQLDRRVALKLLSRARSEDTQGRIRMLREAQAMARLTHPNVVAVHDVGEFDERTFIAMEFIAGPTIKAWLAAAPRSWRQVLSVFARAGRGLVAAHEVGLVHRDFKPENVLLTLDATDAVTRVLVTDFGLARDSSDRGETLRDAASIEDTVAFAGTPRYMAPEQFPQAGDRATGPWTDQFSFCVALYEALFGERPFEGTTVHDLGEAVVSGRVREPASRTGVPWRIRQAVLRGLRVDRSQRHPSMQALLAILEHDPARVRRGVVAGGLVVAAAVTAASVQLMFDPGTRKCERGAAEIESVWNEGRSETIAQAFGALSVPGAGSRWSTMAPNIDAHVAAWREMYVETCTATLVRGQQSGERMDARMRCLQDDRDGLDAVLAELGSVDDVMAQRLETMVLGLPSVDRCIDPRGPSFADLDADSLAAVEEGRRQLAVADARNIAGRYVAGITAADLALAAIDGVAVPELRGRILKVKGQLQNRAGESVLAEATLRAALSELAPVGAHEGAAEAWIELIFVVGDALSRPQEALAMQLAAELELAAMGGDAFLQRRLETVLGAVYAEAGKLDEAVAHHQAAIALGESSGASAPALLVLYGNYGNTLYDLGRYREALDAHQHAYDLAVRAYGDAHVQTSTDMMSVARDAEKLGEGEKARALYLRALSIREESLGRDSKGVGEILLNLGVLEYANNELAAAREHGQRALQIFEHRLGPDHVHVAIAHNHLGTVANAEHDGPTALAHYAEAIRIYTLRFGADHPKVAVPNSNAGNVLLDMGDYEAAIARYDRSLEIKTKALGPDHPGLAFECLDKARALIELERFDEAVAMAERGVGLREGVSFDPGELSTGYFVLAQALWAASSSGPAERTRALQLGRKALVIWRDSGIQDTTRLATYEAWLRERGGDLSLADG